MPNCREFSPELDSCTDGFEHHIDLDSPADRHQELSGNFLFPLTPLPVNSHLLHDQPGFPPRGESNCTVQDSREFSQLATSKRL